MARRRWISAPSPWSDSSAASWCRSTTSYELSADLHDPGATADGGRGAAPDRGGLPQGAAAGEPLARTASHGARGRRLVDVDPNAARLALGSKAASPLRGGVP